MSLLASEMFQRGAKEGYSHMARVTCSTLLLLFVPFKEELKKSEDVVMLCCGCYGCCVCCAQHSKFRQD